MLSRRKRSRTSGGPLNRRSRDRERRATCATLKLRDSRASETRLVGRSTSDRWLRSLRLLSVRGGRETEEEIGSSTRVIATERWERIPRFILGHSGRVPRFAALVVFRRIVTTRRNEFVGRVPGLSSRSRLISRITSAGSDQIWRASALCALRQQRCPRSSHVPVLSTVSRALSFILPLTDCTKISRGTWTFRWGSRPWT